ncbi:MAG: hypothetical protein RRZ65_09395 [Tannerellaceae bacterium]
MKTKKILLSAFAFSAIFAGCSNEDLITVDNRPAAQDLSMRPEVGQVNFDFGAAKTRIAIKDGSTFNWDFQDGDQVGACIIDQANYTTKKEYADWTIDGSHPWLGKSIDNPEPFYSLVNYVSSNYPYTYSVKDKKWTTCAKLVEGNYMFYAPFNEKMLTREPVVTKLSVIQDCSTPSKAVEDLLASKTPVAVGYQALKAEGQELVAQATMLDIYSYPEFTIKNNFNGYVFDAQTSTGGAKEYEMIIDSIQIFSVKENHVYPAEAAINHEKLVTNLKPGANGGLCEWQKLAREKAATADILAVSPNADFKKATDFQSAKGVGSILGNIIKRTEKVTLKIGKTLAPKGEYRFNAVLPAEAYEKDNMKANVFVTIAGKQYVIAQTQNSDTKVFSIASGKATAITANLNQFSWTFDDTKHANKDGVTLLRKQRYPASEIESSLDGPKKEFAGTLLTINLTGGKTEGAFLLDQAEKNYGIKTNEELVGIVNSYARYVDVVEDAALSNTPQTDWGNLKFAIASDNTIEINSALIDRLYDINYNEAAGIVQGSLEINATTVKISGDVKASIGTKEGEVYPVTFTSTTGKNKTYTIKLKMGDITATQIDKAGYYYLATGQTIDTATIAEQIAGYVHIFNNGTLSLDESAKNASSIINNGTLTLTGGVLNSALTIYNNNSATITTSGIITATISNAKGANLTVDAGSNLRSANNVNNGTITMQNASSVATIGLGSGIINNDELGKVAANEGQTVFATVSKLTEQNAKINSTEITAAMGLNLLKVTGTQTTALVTGLSLINAPYTTAGVKIKTLELSNATITTTTGGALTMPIIMSGMNTWAGADTGATTNVTGAQFTFNDAATLALKLIDLAGTKTQVTAGEKSITAPASLATWNGKSGNF